MDGKMDGQTDGLLGPMSTCPGLDLHPLFPASPFHFPSAVGPHPRAETPQEEPGPAQLMPSCSQGPRLSLI